MCSQQNERRYAALVFILKKRGSGRQPTRIAALSWRSFFLPIIFLILISFSFASIETQWPNTFFRTD